MANPKGVTVIATLRSRVLEELRASLLEQHPQLQVVARPVDLSNADDVDRVVAEVHKAAEDIDVLVNNAGVGDQELFDRADWRRTRQLLHTNVLAVAQLTAALVPSMVRRGRGG